MYVPRAYEYLKGTINKAKRMAQVPSLFVKSIYCHTKSSQQLLPTPTDSEQRYGTKQPWAVPAQGAAAGRSSHRHAGSAGDRHQHGFCITVLRDKLNQYWVTENSANAPKFI